MRTTIRSVFDGLLATHHEAWVFFPEGEEWSLDSPCHLLRDEESEHLEDEKGWRRFEEGGITFLEGLHADDIDQIVNAAEYLQDPPSLELLLEALVYYYKFDAFLPTPNAEPPPSTEEIKKHLDDEFLESLGEERPEVPCGRTGCLRGAVRLSRFCPLHHFEMVKGYPYGNVE